MQVFLGIPFAEPPVGELRWRPPKPIPGPLESGIGASSLEPHRRLFSDNGAIGPISIGSKSFFRSFPFRPLSSNIPLKIQSCHSLPLSTTYTAETWNHHLKCYGPQPDPVASEDCLYLNVWVPPPAISGAFVTCWTSSPIFDPQTLCCTQRIIIVTTSYRCGVLGFARHPHPTSPNPGLLDLIQAFRWVRSNIGVFNGNPQNITAWGESAGAIALHYIAMAPGVEEGLFQRLVLQSGVAMSALPRSREVAEVGRLLDVQKGLMVFRPRTERRVKGKNGEGVPVGLCGPIMDGEIVVEDVVGGTMFVLNVKSRKDVDDHLSNFPPAMVEEMHQLYGPLTDDNDHAFKLAADYVGDLSFNLPITITLHHLSRTLPTPHHPLHVYHFSRTPPYPTSLAIYNTPLSRLRAAHTIDIPYVLGTPLLDTEWPGERPVSETVGRLWGSFCGVECRGSRTGTWGEGSFGWRGGAGSGGAGEFWGVEE
ncbi:Alpha/Beta hydrolase protein [Chytridium lagenaria]|nr:Alpha/Beta hydrolase protein [Chytridium lagenaria]